MAQFHSISQCLPPSSNTDWLGKAKESSSPTSVLHCPRRIEIKGFQGIEAFPEWLGKLSSLKRLTIYLWDELMYLPSVDVMRSHPKLETINILRCPQLKTRCERESGPEWSKISHIPRIYINRRSIQFMDGDF